MRGRERANDLLWLERYKERRHGDALGRRHCGGVIQSILFTVDFFILGMLVGSSCTISYLMLEISPVPGGGNVYKKNEMQSTKLYILNPLIQKEPSHLRPYQNSTFG